MSMYDQEALKNSAMKNSVFDSPLLKAPPGVVLSPNEAQAEVQLVQFAKDRERAQTLLKRILDRQVVYVSKAAGKNSLS